MTGPFNGGFNGRFYDGDMGIPENVKTPWNTPWNPLHSHRGGYSGISLNLVLCYIMQTFVDNMYHTW